ncbi:MAG: hypothetical protein R2802_06310 [Flavobacteriaceae bacterium]|nr:hypothetical protein [Mangrovimonas sp.]MCB0469429.1 hypothetical protein [Flavobacteriaceae bacterium]MCB0433127.1 hypothetical protein [Mangrovimonas sp.]MCB0435768.1 hypothetical protein [Mangrovimonas sp.]MCB0438252.1 hypothetical protein [Mangrovimonas sp.]
MKRLIVDYKKLNKDILDLLVEKFPDGYDDSDIITFRNLKNEVVEAVEVRTEDTIYLVKVGTRLIQAMEDYGDEDTNEREEDGADVDFEDVKNQDDDEITVKPSGDEDEDEDEDNDSDYDDQDDSDDVDGDSDPDEEDDDDY